MTQEEFNRAKRIKEEAQSIISNIEVVENNITECAALYIDIGMDYYELPNNLFTKDEILGRLNERLSMLNEQFKEL